MADFCDDGYDRLTEHMNNRRVVSQLQIAKIQNTHDKWNKINEKRRTFGLPSEHTNPAYEKYIKYLENKIVNLSCDAFIYNESRANKQTNIKLETDNFRNDVANFPDIEYIQSDNLLDF